MTANPDPWPEAYAVAASVSAVHDGWTQTRTLPTFYLATAVQGIVSADHAERIARDLIGSVADVATGGRTVLDVSVSVAPV